MIKTTLELIVKEKLIFIDETAALLGIARGTFYNLKLDECQAIIDALMHNRSKIKQGLRAKWYRSDNPTAQIALYRLTASEDELERLTVSKHRIETIKEQPLFPDTPDATETTNDIPTDNGNQ
jgi:glutamate/tyrosine decarboxylase-like PLP-dependent enzyme